MNINYKPVLIDFDGVIKVGKNPVEDAGDFLEFLSKNKIPSYIISNSTLNTSSDLIKFLNDNGIDFDIPAMTAVDATFKYVKDRYRTISVYCDEKIKKVFKDLIDDRKPDAVVIGDLGEEWNYKNMNEIFSKIFKGADLIAMQKNKYWTPDGKTITLDAGAFITGLEYAASKESVLVGKPSEIYFRTALNLLDYKGDEFYMIGDDLETDVNAAQNLGGRGILVYTGKTNYPLPENVNQKPDYEAKNLTEVKNILSEIFNI